MTHSISSLYKYRPKTFNNIQLLSSRTRRIRFGQKNGRNHENCHGGRKNEIRIFGRKVSNF